MFSVIFPGQGSQIIGMGREFFEKHNLVKELFQEADDVLGMNLSKIILEGPKDKLDLTANTQPAIFLISYSIFNVVKKEYKVDLNQAKYFAGHSLGEYSALSSAGYLDFSSTLKYFLVIQSQFFLSFSYLCRKYSGGILLCSHKVSSPVKARVISKIKFFSSTYLNAFFN